MAICTISGTIVDVSETPLTDVEVGIEVLEPQESGTNWVASKRVAATTDTNGDWSLACIRGVEARITIFMPTSADSVVPVAYIVTVPNTASANFEDLI